MEFLIDQSKEIIIRGKDIESISQPFTQSNSFQIKSIDKEKLIIKTELDIHSINQLLPKNSLVRSVSKEPNLADLFK